MHDIVTKDTTKTRLKKNIESIEKDMNSIAKKEGLFTIKVL